MRKHLLDGKGDWIPCGRAITEALTVIKINPSIQSKHRNYLGQRIRDAARQGRFGRRHAKNGVEVEKRPFVAWACEQWPELREHTVRPLEVAHAAIKVDGPSVALRLGIPSNYDELAACYERVSNELAIANKKLRKCRSELAAIKKKARKTGHLKKTAGRKGGRPRKGR